MKIIINADDLGISKGTNYATKETHIKGCLTHSSLMVNTRYFKHALENVVEKCPALKIGLHLNLTYGKPVSDVDEVPLLVNKNGTFKHSMMVLFLKLLMNKKKYLKQLEVEIENQLHLIKKNVPFIEHINGHEHVHLLPGVKQIVKRKCTENAIRFREINEGLFRTFWVSRNHHVFFPKNILKYFIIKFLSGKVNRENYFFSILLTERIKFKDFKNLIDNHNYNQVEVMVHINKPTEDTDAVFESKLEKRHVLSQKRYAEYQQCLLKLDSTNDIY